MKFLGSGRRSSDLSIQKTLIILNEEINNIMKMLKSLEESGLLI